MMLLLKKNPDQAPPVICNFDSFLSAMKARNMLLLSRFFKCYFILKLRIKGGKKPNSANDIRFQMVLRWRLTNGKHTIQLIFIKTETKIFRKQHGGEKKQPVFFLILAESKVDFQGLSVSYSAVLITAVKKLSDQCGIPFWLHPVMTLRLGRGGKDPWTWSSSWLEGGEKVPPSQKGMQFPPACLPWPLYGSIMDPSVPEGSVNRGEEQRPAAKVAEHQLSP